MTISMTLGTELLQGEFTINTATTGDQINFDLKAKADGGFVVVYGDDDGTARTQELDADFNLTDQNLIDTLSLPGGAYQVTDAEVVQQPDGFLIAIVDVSDQSGGFASFEFGRNSNGELVFPNDFEIGVATTAINPDATVLNNGTVVVSFIDTNGTDQARFIEVDVDNESFSQTTLGAAQITDAAVASLTGGGFVAAFIDTSTTDGQVAFQRFDANGNSVGSLTRPYSKLDAGAFQGVEVIGLPGGGFALAIDDGALLALQVFNASGTNITPNGFTIVSDDRDEQDIGLTLIDDSFIALSYTRPFSATDDDARVQLFELNGTAIGGPISIAQTLRNERDVKVAGSVDGSGVFLTTFTDDNSTGDGSGSSVQGIARQIVRNFTGDGDNDNFLGNASGFREIMRGNGGADTIAGGGGRDDLFGGDGDDQIIIIDDDNEFGPEVLSGGADTDRLTFANNIAGDRTFDLTDDDVSGFELYTISAIAGSAASDVNVILNASQFERNGGALNGALASFGTTGEATFTINADLSATLLSSLTFGNGFGSSPDQRLIVNIIDQPGAAPNVLRASAIADEINGSEESDFITLSSGGGRDTVRAGDGSDTVTLENSLGDSPAGEVFDGGEGQDQLVFLVTQAEFNGFLFQDVELSGFETFQFINPGEEVGFISLTLNASQFEEENGVKTAAFDTSSLVGEDEIFFILNADEADTDLSGLTFTDEERFDLQINASSQAGGSLTGSVLSEVINGSFLESGDDIDGDGGDDQIRGNGGADTLAGGQGVDSLFGGGGNDRFFADD
ncbi:MAG: hypothetical protein AAFN79_22165, partial [Pseudomonadota bacterium]